MVVGKYHCDYCDKQFQDTPFARKRHLQGVQHLRAKSLWYDSLSAQVSQQSFPEGKKGLCHQFIKTYSCPYGDSCKYLHFKISNPQKAETQATGFIDNAQSSSVDPRIQLVGGSSLPGDVVRDSMGMSWGNLPPSLKPPPEGGYPPPPFVDWG
ncbi:hypothetical protein Patl1_23939 [Pistacia atlantica]|uniref:Uncharacterized protein n=1 Tax=Pistacia atlantica TaxID=434234 RepID=A0ACC1A049_9ROSI|nr:hypothetical protein Patl1_23939 [Pistacia atlantica]